MSKRHKRRYFDPKNEKEWNVAVKMIEEATGESMEIGYKRRRAICIGPLPDRADPRFAESVSNVQDVYAELETLGDLAEYLWAPRPRRREWQVGCSGEHLVWIQEEETLHLLDKGGNTITLWEKKDLEWLKLFLPEGWEHGRVVIGAVDGLFGAFADTGLEYANDRIGVTGDDMADIAQTVHGAND